MSLYPAFRRGGNYRFEGVCWHFVFAQNLLTKPRMHQTALRLVLIFLSSRAAVSAQQPPLKFLCGSGENYPPSKHTTIHYSCGYAPFLSCIYLCAPLFVHYNGLHTPPCRRAERWPILPLGAHVFLGNLKFISCLHEFQFCVCFSLIWTFVFEFVCLGKRCRHERLHDRDCRNLCM